jgi:polyhydroxyalkanoate synthase
MTVLGAPVDPLAVDVDTYVVAGSTDHIVPWRAAYRTTQLTGGETDFVLSSSGHIQAMVNPPARKPEVFVPHREQDTPGRTG